MARAPDDFESAESVEYDESAPPTAKPKRRKKGGGKQAHADGVEPTISVHLYEWANDSARWQEKHWTWEELPDKLLTLGRLSYAARKDNKDFDKFSLPVWCPVTTAENIGRRRKEDIETVEVLALDFDAKLGREPTVEDLQELFQAWDGWAYTSWSHTAKAPRARVVIRLDDSVLPQQYTRIWHWAERRAISAGFVVDPQRKNANSVWFAPVQKAEFEERRWKGLDGALPTQLILTGVLKREEHGGEGFEALDEDLVIDYPGGRTSIVSWAETAPPGEKLKCACPFNKDSSMGSAFLRKRASGVLIVCTSANHGHPAPYRRWWQDPKAGGTTKSPDRALTDRLDWKIDKEGRRLAIRPTLHNVQLILSEDPRWVGRLWDDEFAECRILDGRRWDGKQDVWTVRLWLEQVYGIEPAIEVVQGGVMLVGAAKAKNSLTGWLDGLKWDGTPRLDDWIVRTFGVEDDAVHRAIGRKFIIQMVARAYEPGCKADYMLVLVGEQGDGKGKALRALAGPDRFSDTLFDIGHKDAYQQLKGVWLYEFGELASIKGHANIEMTKSYLTSATDRYRKSYGEESMPHPRKTCFVGTTNEPQFLYDTTGNRRYWPVLVTRADDVWMIENRDQLFAEAVVAYNADEGWYFPKVEEPAIAEHTKQFEAREVIAEPIEAWLRSTKYKVVTSSDVLAGALEMRPGQYDRSVETRVGIVMKRDLGWRKTRVRIVSADFDAYVFYHPSLSADAAKRYYLKRVEARGVAMTDDVVIEFPVPGRS